MPAKSTTKSKRPAPKSRVVASKRQSRFQRYSSNKFLMLATVLVIGALGAYFIALSNADPALPANDAARGLYYSSTGERKVKNGPCKEDLNDTTNGQSQANIVSCTHPDPGPEGVDVRQRAKQIEKQLAAQVDYDKKNPPKNAGEPNQPQPITTTAYDVGAKGSLSDVTGNPWPCVDTSAGTPRIHALYVYKSGNSNRLSTLRDAFEGIARRTNAVMYNSSVASGSARQYRFAHGTSVCSNLAISPVAVTGDMSSFGNIINQLRAKGYNDPLTKYLAWVDTDTGCGQGTVKVDTQPGQSNANNYGNTFAVVWRPCWNYAEPHELMHTLGAVEADAPYSTAGYHCFDQHDVMCYNDGTHAMSQVCLSSVYIWRYDCKYNTYFNSGTPAAGSYLATHWNTANSRFLTHY